MSAGGSRAPWHAWALLAVTSAAFLAFAWHYVPRLNNYVMSDREFTGWTGPIAERLAAGERPYVDFVLPIPPGSFVVLASVQRLMGRALLVQELWVGALSQLALSLVGYGIARTLVSPRVAALAASATLVTLLQLPKECAYDHTAQLFAWGSIALGATALTANPGRRRAGLWTACGLAAALTLGFKQSTATGVLLGWAAAFAYTLARSRRVPGAVAAADVRAWLVGGALGLVAVAALVVACGGTVGGFVQSVLVDAGEVKGGRSALARTLASHVTLRPVFSGSLVVTAALLVVAARVLRRRETLGAEGRPDVPSGAGWVAFSAGVVLLTFGGATALLVAEARALPTWLAPVVHRTGELPGIGLVLVAGHFVVHAFGAAGSDPVRRERSHFDAVAIVSLTASLLHDASFDQFGTFYNNNPIVVVAFAGLFGAAVRVSVPGLLGLTFALSLVPLFGRKLDRALSADTPADPRGHWAGLRVNYRGREIEKAAARVRELTSEREAVLVLPEDVQLVGLIDRPRPDVVGAILFVDQYPRRLLQEDLRRLHAHPPKVVVIHPRSERDWRRLFATWNERSAAAAVMESVTRELLPGRYRLDSSYPTVHFWDQGQLDVHVRLDDPPFAAEAPKQ